MGKRYKHIKFKNIEKHVELQKCLRFWMFSFNTLYQTSHPLFTTTNLSKNGSELLNVPVPGAVCTKQMMALYHAWCFWTKSWRWTSSICGTSLWISSFSLRPSKNQKNFKNYTKKSRETLEKLKDLFSGSLGQDMSAARVAENSKGDRRCLDEICARRNTYMCW